MTPLRTVRCVGAIVFDGGGRLLLVQRGHAPAVGRWSIPGGRVEPGETDQQAVVREVAEETGLVVRVGDLAGMVERPGMAGSVYEIYDYDCAVVGSVGPIGPIGPVGPVGLVGSVGSVGAVGPVGPVGPVGSVGAVGSVGSVGSGDAGDGSGAHDAAGSGAAVADAGVRTRAATEAMSRAAAGDDAADLRWVAPSDLGALPLTNGLVEALRGWHRLP